MLWKNETEKYNNVSNVTLGDCTEIRMVDDIINAAKEHPMILFHSTDPRHPLYDFMYHNSTDGTFHAFQATIGKTHPAKEAGLKDLRNELGTSSLDLYYLVREECFKEFVTSPVEPAKDDIHTRIWHMVIPNPDAFISRKRCKSKCLNWYLEQYM
jgi:hypothetical protein